MTAIPSNRPAPMTAGGGRHAAPSAPVPVASIDPIKLVKKYKWILASAVFLGAVLGVGSHYALLSLYPVWRSAAIFQCYNVSDDPGRPAGSGATDDVELDRFMQTQKSLMTTELVLSKVAEDPRLPNDAPRWSKRFFENGVFNNAEALIELKDDVTARVLPQTRFIELSVSYRDRRDAANLVKLCREAYQRVLVQQVTRGTQSQRDALAGAIRELGDQIEQAQLRRKRIMADRNIDTINRQSNDTQQNLSVINQQLVNVRLDLEALRTRSKAYEEELQNPGGINFSDQLRDEVETEPLMLSIKQQITQLQSERQALLLRLTPIHRLVKELDAQLEGYNKSLDETRQRLLRQKFDAQVDSTRKGINQLEAQEADLSSRQGDLARRLAELTQAQAELDDIDKAIQQLIESRSEMAGKLQNINALQQLDNANRVLVIQEERIPSVVSFPKLKIMIPAGVILITGLVTALLVARELLDNRIKSPSDVAMIPRARVVGLIPDASEDPSAPGAVETAFRDRPKGVIAESFRQVRSVLGKRMDAAAHKSLVIVSAMPGSGATSVVTNLALVGAAAGQRVLVIDANMRRPAVQRIFGLNEGPGLADVIMDRVTLEGAVQRAGDDRLHVLTAGSKELRASELLHTEAMTKMLRKARELYDIVYIDVSPAMVSGDGVAIANRCDASMLVVRALSETRGMVARMSNELSDTRGEMLGVLVNGVRSSAGGYLRSNLKATHEYLNT